MAIKTGKREAWLEASVKALRPKFKAAGYPIPAKVRVSCGWPATGGTSRRNRRIGECWPATSSEGKVVEMFVSPTEAKSHNVIGTLVHELIHAVLPDAGHGPKFKSAMHSLGLIGKATATDEGAELKREIAVLARGLGKYPHASIKLSHKETKPQSTRLLKIECPGCGYVARTTQKWIEMGFPTCYCGSEFVLS
jgi:hypothetical protein